MTQPDNDAALRALLFPLATERGMVHLTLDRLVEEVTAVVEVLDRDRLAAAEAAPLRCPACQRGDRDPHARHAARLAAEAAPLDVERLARAIDRVEKGIASRHPSATVVSQRKAADIARAYAAEPEPGEGA
jgi:hypothetical protein